MNSKVVNDKGGVKAMIQRLGQFLARPFRWFLTPPECPVCYWGRLTAMGAVGALLPGWWFWVFATLIALSAVLVWIMEHAGE